MFKNIVALFALMVFALPVFSAPAAAPVKKAPQTAAPVKQTPQVVNTTPLAIVNSPSAFLNKQIVMTGKFDKFSTLGLDYKKALRDSSKYISFLIQRDDIKDHNIPLSELKLFLKREYAEKFIDLSTGDKIKISGNVFSNALGDAWIDVQTIEIIEKAPSNSTK